MVGEATPNASGVEQPGAINLTAMADGVASVSHNGSLLSPPGWQTIRRRALSGGGMALASAPFREEYSDLIQLVSE